MTLAERKADLEQALEQTRRQIAELSATALRIEGGLATILALEAEQAEAAKDDTKKD